MSIKLVGVAFSLFGAPGDLLRRHLVLCSMLVMLVQCCACCWGFALYHLKSSHSSLLTLNRWAAVRMLIYCRLLPSLARWWKARLPPGYYPLRSSAATFMVAKYRFLAARVRSISAHCFSWARYLRRDWRLRLPAGWRSPPSFSFTIQKLKEGEC